MKNEAKTFFSLQDFAYTYRKNRKKILRWCYLCFFFSFAFLLLQTPRYLVKGVFQFNIANQTESNNLLQLIKTNTSATSKEDVKIILQSKKFSYPIIRREGLQVLYHNQSSLISKATRRFFEGCYAFWGIKLPDRDRFVFANVNYDKEEPIYFYIKFINEEEFEISLPQGERLLGKLHVPIALLDGKITIVQKPKEALRNQKYFFSIQPMENAYKQWKNMFSIVKDPLQKKFLTISCLNRDRQFATYLVNVVLKDFRNYLKDDSECVAKDHLDFLHKRHKIVSQNFHEIIKNSAKQLEKNLDETGFLYFDTEIKRFIKQQEKLVSKLQNIKFCLKRLKNSFPEKKQLLPDGYRFTSNLSKQICDLKKQKNDLELVLYEKNGNFQQDFTLKKPREDLKKEILKVKAHQEKVQSILQQLQEIEGLSITTQIDYPEMFQNLDFSLFSKEDQVDYFCDVYHELQLKEKFLQNQQNEILTFSSIYEGISFPSAQKLYLLTQEDIEKTNALIKLYEHCFTKLNQPEFEWSSLSTIPNDETVRSISQKATELRLKLEDRKNRTKNELARLKEELKLQKRFLQQHVSETMHTNQMNLDFYENKLNMLRSVMIHCIDREIASLIQHGEDFKRSKIANLLEEKKIVENQLEALKHQMKRLPEKWQKNQELSLQKDLSLHVMKTMTELIESKTLSQSLSDNSSRPFDLAVPPLNPKNNYILFVAMIFGVLGGCGCFTWKLFQQSTIGFPINPVKLNMLDSVFLGFISFACDGHDQDYISDQDLETLRQMMCFIGKKSPTIVTIIGGEGPHFGHLLSSLFAQQGISVLLMDCFFQHKIDDTTKTGVKQCIKDLRLFKTQKQPEGYEYLPSGGTTRFGAEIIGSRQFSRLIEKIKNNYDIILLYSKTSLHFAEAKNFLPLIDKCIISVMDEDTSDVYNFSEYVQKHTKVELSFITVEK